MSLTKKTKSFLSFLFRIGLSIGLLWYVFSMIDMEGTVETLKEANLNYIVFAALVFTIVNCILLFRWLFFIKALDLSIPLKSVVTYYLYGLFGNLFLPSAMGGDLIKVFGLSQKTTEKPKVVASVLIDRLSGFASIIIIEVIVLITGYSNIIQDKVLFTGVVMIGCGSIVGAIFLFNEKVYSFGCKIFDPFPKIKNSLMTMHYDIALLKGEHKSKEGYKAVVASCLSQAVFAFSWFLVAKALGQDIAYVHFIAFVPLLCIASAFPSIGGLGVREAGAVYLFSKVGIAEGVSVSLSLINFLFMVMVGLVGGFLYVYTLSVGRIQSNSPDAVNIESGNA